jgi:hypothetical protein
MLRLAARYADVWDTFATTPGTATQRVATNLAARVRTFESACRLYGRAPEGVRRSTWVGGDVLESEAAYRGFVNTHRALGFTDLMCGLPESSAWGVARRIAANVLPELRDADLTDRSTLAARAVTIS